MSVVGRVAIAAAAAAIVCAASGCSNIGGQNRQINPTAVKPMTEAQRQAEIKAMIAKNPHFHVPQYGPGSQNFQAADVAPYLRPKSSAAPGAPPSR